MKEAMKLTRLLAISILLSPIILTASCGTIGKSDITGYDIVVGVYKALTDEENNNIRQNDSTFIRPVNNALLKYLKTK